MTADRDLRLVRLWRGLGYAGIAILLIGCLWPQPGVAGGAGIDKLLHFAAFALLAGWFGAVLGMGRYAAVAAGLAVLGVVIEALQWVTGYRSAELLDWVADVAGVGVGLALARPLVAPCLGYIDGRVAAARNRA